MEGFLIIAGTGLILVVLGVLLLKKEKKTFSETDVTKATVVDYYQNLNYDGIAITDMYTMAVEYYDEKGNLIRAKELSSTNRKKYKIGTEISITYSLEKPDFFVKTGDKSRYIIFYGMIFIGLLMIFVLGTAILKQ